MNMQDSLDRILANGVEFSESFYQQLSEDHPDVFAHFEGINMKHQANMLNNSLMLCTQEQRLPTQSLKYYLRLLGTKHSDRGVPKDAYDCWTNTMLTSLEQYIGDDWSDELDSEWRSAFETATKIMFVGYDERQHI